MATHIGSPVAHLTVGLYRSGRLKQMQGLQMKTTLSVKSLTIGAVLGAIAAFSIAAASSEWQGQKWEYDVLFGPNSRELNQAGKDGWEAFAIAESGGLMVYVKRPLR
jgi:hypothetical protein